jgi:hypothetical protein
MAFKMKGFPMHNSASALKQKYDRENRELGFGDEGPYHPETGAHSPGIIKNDLYNFKQLLKQGMSGEEAIAMQKEVEKEQREMQEDLELNEYFDKRNQKRILEERPNISLEELDKLSQEMTDRQWDVKRKSSGVRIPETSSDE